MSTSARTASPAAQTAATALRSLTGLRWVAAFDVFAYHVRNFGYFAGRTGRAVNLLFGVGYVGVSFFFVLSGFVLAYSAPAADSAARFWLRRFARIYPLHLVTALTAIALASSWASPPARAGASGTLANLLLVSSWWRARTQVLNPVSWSLTCEAFFYACFPLALAGVKRIGSSLHLAALLAVGIAATIALPACATAFEVTRDLRFYPPARLPEFLVGVVLARLVRARAWHGPGLRTATLLTAIGYALVPHVAFQYEYAACTIVGFAVLIPAMALRDERGGRSVWASPLLVRLGELSFAFYLIHIVVMRTAQAVPAARPGAGWGPALVVFAVSIGLACALNEFVERPARLLLLSAVR